MIRTIMLLSYTKKKQFFHDFIYSLSETELKVFKAYLDKHLINDFIRSFKLSADASILFVRKKNDNLRLCVNYKNFNSMIIKNRYSLLLIEKSLNKLSRIRRFINLNFIVAYHRMRIKQSDE